MIQRRFTRMIPGLKKLPYNSRLKELKLWTLEERRKRSDLIEVYKMTRGLSAVDFNKFFTLDLHSRTHGHSWKLKTSRFNTDLWQQFFSERVVSWWNKLDEDRVTACSVNSFKGKLQKMTDNSDEFLLGQWLSDKLLWPSQLPWRGQSSKLSNDSFSSNIHWTIHSNNPDRPILVINAHTSLLYTMCNNFLNYFLVNQSPSKETTHVYTTVNIMLHFHYTHAPCVIF